MKSPSTQTLKKVTNVRYKSGSTTYSATIQGHLTPSQLQMEMLKRHIGMSQVVFVNPTMIRG
jgi:hypothetical protein